MITIFVNRAVDKLIQDGWAAMQPGINPKPPPSHRIRSAHRNELLTGTLPVAKPISYYAEKDATFRGLLPAISHLNDKTSSDELVRILKRFDCPPSVNDGMLFDFTVDTLWEQTKVALSASRLGLFFRRGGIWVISPLGATLREQWCKSGTLPKLVDFLMSMWGTQISQHVIDAHKPSWFYLRENPLLLQLLKKLADFPSGINYRDFLQTTNTESMSPDVTTALVAAATIGAVEFNLKHLKLSLFGYQALLNPNSYLNSNYRTSGLGQNGRAISEDRVSLGC